MPENRNFLPAPFHMLPPHRQNNSSRGQYWQREWRDFARCRPFRPTPCNCIHWSWNRCFYLFCCRSSSPARSTRRCYALCSGSCPLAFLPHRGLLPVHPPRTWCACWWSCSDRRQTVPARCRSYRQKEKFLYCWCISAVRWFLWTERAHRREPEQIWFCVERFHQPGVSNPLTTFAAACRWCDWECILLRSIVRTFGIEGCTSSLL